MKKENTHTSRELWLASATNELRPYFAVFGHAIPDKIRYAISFTSGGKQGVSGEVWHPPASGDGSFEIIIKADRDDPLEILIILMRLLIRTLLPSTVKYGKEFRDIALRLGMEGKMREATPTPPLRGRLNDIVANLGSLPHARLDFNRRPDALKKSGVRMLKAECAICAYSVHVLPKFARRALPFCPIDPTHGALVCDKLDDVIDENMV